MYLLKKLSQNIKTALHTVGGYGKLMLMRRGLEDERRECFE